MTSRSRRPPTDDELDTAARRLGRALVKRGWQMASAESCTGGLVGHVITQVPRSSDHYLGGIISYSNAVKGELLDVPADLIERVGAVSSEVAESMTAGTLERFPVAHLALAVTGIAGPDGGTPQKPVGTVFFGLAVRGEVTSRRFRFPGDRVAVKWQSAQTALDLLRRSLGGVRL